MKTAFFIFGLAETASVTAEMKSQLYTFAYTVSPGFGLGMLSLQPPSWSFFSPFSFKFLEPMEIQCFHTGPVIRIPLVYPNWERSRFQRDLFRDFIHSYLPPRSRRMPKANQSTPCFCYNYVVCAGLQTHAKRLLVLKSPLCTCPLCHYTVVRLSQQV